MKKRSIHGSMWAFWRGSQRRNWALDVCLWWLVIKKAWPLYNHAFNSSYLLTPITHKQYRGVCGWVMLSPMLLISLSCKITLGWFVFVTILTPRFFTFKLMGPPGIEPGTYRLWAGGSASWAMGPNIHIKIDYLIAKNDFVKRLPGIKAGKIIIL